MLGVGSGMAQSGLAAPYGRMGAGMQFNADCPIFNRLPPPPTAHRFRPSQDVLFWPP